MTRMGKILRRGYNIKHEHGFLAENDSGLRVWPGGSFLATLCQRLLVG